MVSIKWFLSQFWKDRNENTRQKLDHENEVMAYWEEKVAEVGEEDEEEAEKLPVRLWAKRGGLQLLWQLQTSQYYSLGRSYPPNGPSRRLSRCCSHRRLEKSFFVRAERSMRCLPRSISIWDEFLSISRCTTMWRKFIFISEVCIKLIFWRGIVLHLSVCLYQGIFYYLKFM